MGNVDTYNFLKNKLKPNWDWQIPVPTIDEFWEAIDSQRLADDTSIIMVSSEFYADAYKQKNREELEGFLRLVFISTQVALTIVVDYFNEASHIESDLLKFSGRQDPSEGALHRYWWLDPKKPAPMLDAAINEYINSPDSDPDTVQSIADAENMTLSSTPQGVDEESSSDQNNNEWFDTSDGLADSSIPFSNNYGKLAQIICVTSSKGGVGKTTTAMGIGEWLAASSQQSVNAGTLSKPLKVCIVDLDVSDAQIGSMIGKSTPNILSIAILNNVTPDVVAKNLIYNERMKCWFLLAPKLPKSADNIPPAKYDETLNVLRYMFDVIILDTSVNYKSDLLSTVAYPKADKILFITSLDRKSVVGMMKWIIYTGSSRENNGSEIDLDKIAVVTNMAMKGVKMTKNEIQHVIDISTARVYATLDRGIQPEDWHKPKLIGAIPAISNGVLIKLSNMQDFRLALNIPSFEAAIGEVTRNIIPTTFKQVLPRVNPEQ